MGEGSGGVVLLGVLAAVSVLVAGWFRERRANHRSWWRFAALLVAAVALLALIVQPGLKRAVDLQTALVLTPGATREMTEENGLEIDSSVLSVALAGVDRWHSGTRSAPDLATFLRRHPEVGHLQVIGTGLEPWDLADLKPSVGSSGLVAPEPGVAAISWRRRLRLGEWLRVTGHIVGLGRGTATLDLEGPGGSDASIELSPDGSGTPTTFTLRVKPPGTGRFRYRLSMAAPSAPSRPVEIVDVEVVDEDLPAILWLEDAPSFETKYFKGWLEREGGELAIRTRVSRDRQHLEFHNLDSFSIGGLEWDLMRRFDLLIVEQRAWERLSPTEISVVIQAVRETGLGVLVRLGPSTGAEEESYWPLGFSANRIANADHLLVHPRDETGAKVAPVESPPFELVLEPGMAPVFTDGAGRILAMMRPLGKGTVGVTLLRQTFSWVLEGHPEAQRSYWHRLIESLARSDSSAAWTVPSGPILVDEPLEMSLERDPDMEPIPVARYGRLGVLPASIAMRQDPIVPSRWTATVWPSAVGWHRLEAEGASLEFYVADSSSWPSWRQQRRRTATRLAALRPRRDRSVGVAQVDGPLPRLPFYAAFLISMGLLWLDERRGLAGTPP